MVTKEFKGLVKVSTVRHQLLSTLSSRRRFLGDEEPITCRPADLLQPEFETMKKEGLLSGQSRRKISSHMQCSPKVAPKFFKDRRE